MNKNAFLCFLFLSVQLTAQWKKNDPTPQPLAVGPGVEFDGEFTTDSVGNSYFAWTDFRNGNGELFVQKLNLTGKVIWEKNGVSLGKVVDGQNTIFTKKSLFSPSSSSVTFQGVGGLNIAWQRIPDVSKPLERQIQMALLSSTDGRQLLGADNIVNSGFIVSSPDVNDDILTLQKYTNRHSVFFNDNSKGLNTVSRGGGVVFFGYSFHLDPVETIASSTFGGSKVIVDQELKETVLIERSSTSDYLIQKFNADLQSVIGPKNFLNNPFPGNSRFDDLYLSKKQIYIGRTLTLADGRKRVIAQKLNENLDNVWKTGGVVLGTDQAYDIHIGENAHGGGIAAWIEPNLTDTKMMAAGISPTGDVLWQKPVFKTQPGKSYFTPHKFASDGKGGCYVMWFTSKAVGFDLSVQHLDAEGNMLWGDYGKNLGDFKWYGVYRLVPHVSGGVVVFYSGSKSDDINANTYDLYTTYLAPDGTFGIEEKPVVTFLRTTYCTGEKLSLQNADNLTAELFSGNSWNVLEKVGNEFVLPEVLEEGNYQIRFKEPGNPASVYSDNYAIRVKGVGSPALNTDKPAFKCKETDEVITLSGTCIDSELRWTTGPTENAILVSPSQTTQYTAFCAREGCANSDSSRIEVKVGEVNATASTSKNAYLEGETLSLQGSGGSSYSWTGPNGFTSSSQNPVIEKVSQSAAGVYTLQVTSAEGCTGSATTAVIINQVLARSSEKRQGEIYPNPATQWLKVRDYTEVKEVNAFASNGRRIPLPFDPFSGLVYLERLSTGEYVLQLSRLDGTSKFVKMIKLGE